MDTNQFRLTEEEIFECLEALPKKNPMFIIIQNAILSKLTPKLEQMQAEIDELKKHRSDFRHYLMSVQPDDLTVERCLIELGYNKNGY